MNPKQKVYSFLYHSLLRLEKRLLQGAQTVHKVEMVAEIQKLLALFAKEYQTAGEIIPPPPPPPPPPPDDFD